jgi:hypothetical protein
MAKLIAIMPPFFGKTLNPQVAVEGRGAFAPILSLVRRRLGGEAVKHYYYPTYLAWIAFAVTLNLLARGRVSPRLRTLGNLAWGLAACAFMVLASEPKDWFYEFRVGYWRAARLAHTDPISMYGVNQLAFVNLPILSLPFLPFASLGEYLAGTVFGLVSVAVAAGAWLQLVRLGKLDGKERWLLAGLFVLNGPLFYCLRQGNATILVLPLLAAALAALLAGQAFRSGMLLAAAGLVKPPLLLLPAYYALRRRWRLTAGSAAVGLGSAALSLLLFGLEVHRAWYERCIQPFAGRALTSYTSQSLSSFLARCLSDGDCGEVWWPVPVDGRFQALHRMLVAALAGVTLLLGLRSAERDRPAAEALDFCLVLCLALVSSPVCWTHYFLLLLLPGALLLGSRVGSPSRGRLAALTCAFLALSPPVRGWSVNRWWQALLVSHYLAGAVLLMGTLAVARQRLGKTAARQDRMLDFKDEPAPPLRRAA